MCLHTMNFKHYHQFPSLVLGQEMHQDKHYTHILSFIFCFVNPIQWKKIVLDTSCRIETNLKTQTKIYKLSFCEVLSKTTMLSSTLLISILNCSSSIQSVQTNLISQHTKLNNKLKEKNHKKKKKKKIRKAITSLMPVAIAINYMNKQPKINWQILMRKVSKR